MPILVRIAQKTVKMKCNDYLKHVRTYLGQHFPGHSFRLSTKRYKGGKSLRVTWTDGPGTADLRGLQELYSGAEIGPGRVKQKIDTIVTLPSMQILKMTYGFDFIILNRQESN